jgi:hypothetical protein
MIINNWCYFLGGLADAQSWPQFYKYIVGAFALSHPNFSSSF